MNRWVHAPSWYHAGLLRAALAPIRAAILGLGLTAVVGFVAGCAATTRRTPVGMSDAVPESRRAPVVEAQPVTWTDFTAARAWPEAAPAFAALAHWRDGSLIHVSVEPEALAAYRELSVESPMPEGARVMAWHETQGGVLLGGYLLEKRAGVWSAQELDANGGLVPGEHGRCVRCHDMAPTDHLFGLRSAPPSAPSSAPASVSAGESIDPLSR